ncbi:MAG: hypothetical protein IJ849_05800 [Selenomonadaceae bacterium]|nr:hypothetical protein [Selenomonadaceae bacterium]
MEGKVLPLPSDRFIRIGKKQGIDQGIEQGKGRLAKLIHTLLVAERTNDIASATTNTKRHKELYHEYGIA